MIELILDSATAIAQSEVFRSLVKRLIQKVK